MKDPISRDTCREIISLIFMQLNFTYACLALSVETPLKFIIAELSIRKLRFSSVLIRMKIRAYGSKALQ